MLDVFQGTDVGWNVVLYMCLRISQVWSLLQFPRSRSVKTTPLMRMETFDEVQFQVLFRFRKSEFHVILSTMLDMDGDKLVDDVGLPVMIRRIGHKTRDYLQYWSDTVLMILLCRLSRWCVLCDLQILLEDSRFSISRIFMFMLTTINNCYDNLVSNVNLSSSTPVATGCRYLTQTDTHTHRWWMCVGQHERSSSFPRQRSQAWVFIPDRRVSKRWLWFFLNTHSIHHITMFGPYMFTVSHLAGVTCCWGPWRGNESGVYVGVCFWVCVCVHVYVMQHNSHSHTLSECFTLFIDSKKLDKTHLLDDLEEISMIHGQDFLAFGKRHILTIDSCNTSSNARRGGPWDVMNTYLILAMLVFGRCLCCVRQ